MEHLRELLRGFTGIGEVGAALVRCGLADDADAVLAQAG